MDVTLPFVFQMMVVQYIFLFVGIALLFLYMRNEILLVQEAIAMTLASDPKLSKKVLTMINDNKKLLKKEQEGNDGIIQ